MSSFFAPITKVEHPPVRPKRRGPTPEAIQKIKARWREGAYDKAKSPTGLSKFCTKEEHARLRFDGIKKCPNCHYSTREPWGCVCHQKKYPTKNSPKDKEYRRKYWREVAGPRRRAAKNLT